MVSFLSPGWLDLHLSLADELPSQPGVTARVQWVVTGAPDGEVRYHQSVVDGRLATLAPGDDPDAEVTLTLPHAVAQQVAQGEVRTDVAFMQGRVKVVGDMGRVMDLMPLLAGDPHRDLLVAVAAQTDF